LILHILGSAAGGGFPQWNCHCSNCAGVRAGTVRASRRTQSSIAVSEDGTDWLLINASPDILHQVAATPALRPARALRDSAICAVLLMDAQIDHVAGLLMLRERTAPLPLYVTDQVYADLTHGLPLANVLTHYCGVERHRVHADGQPFAVAPLLHTAFRAVPLDGKAPPYSPHRHDPHPGDNIGLTITSHHSGRSAFYAPGLASLTDGVLSAMRQADVLLVDGTFWSDDEMIAQGLSTKTAAALGHLPQSGPGGMIALLERMPARRKILIHINNSNPILREDSAERALLTQYGIEVAADGMEIVF